MSSTKKVLVVFGATGYQGGAVANYFLTQPESKYTIRAVTRNPSSPAAQALASSGAELAKADLDDEASMRAALQGADAVFLVTDFFSNGEPNPVREITQGKRAVDVVASIPTVQHFIWSGLPSITRASGGKYTSVVHFDSKEEITKYIEAQYPDLWAKTTVLWVAAYMQLWKQMPAFFAPKKDEKGVWVLNTTAVSESEFPQIDVRETGKVVGAILSKGPNQLAGKTVTAVAESNATMGQGLEIWGRHVGQEVRFQHIEPELVFQGLSAAGLPEFLVKDITEVGLAFRDFGIKLFQGSIFPSAILPEGEKLRDWEEYVKNEQWDDFLNA